MKTIKVSEATGAALDWLVWKCAGGIDAYPKTGSGPAFLKLWRGNSAKYVHPSTDWSQGGPIIEKLIRAGLRLTGYTCLPTDPTRCQAQIKAVVTGGPTPLIAAMRCYVASRFGDEAEVPDELA